MNIRRIALIGGLLCGMAMFPTINLGCTTNPETGETVIDYPRLKQEVHNIQLDINDLLILTDDTQLVLELQKVKSVLLVVEQSIENRINGNGPSTVTQSVLLALDVTSSVLNSFPNTEELNRYRELVIAARIILRRIE